MGLIERNGEQNLLTLVDVFASVEELVIRAFVFLKSVVSLFHGG